MNIEGNRMYIAYMDNPRVNGSGNAIQYMHYLPYGEEWIDQQSTSWNAPYTFTGKIKDAETGYNYFGARYYDSKLSVWLSVDPLSDKYPSLSPYTYCANNPIMMVDPDGRRILILCLGLSIEYKNGKLMDLEGNPYCGDNKFVKTIANGLNEIRNNSLLGRAILTFIEQSDTEVRVTSTDGNPNQSSYTSTTNDDPTNKKIEYVDIEINPEGYPGYVCKNTYMGPQEILTSDVVGDIIHEFSHAFDDMFGVKPYKITHETEGLSGVEWLACFRENIIRYDLGKNLRSRYRSAYIQISDSFEPVGPYLLDDHGNTKTDFLNQ